MKKKNNNNNNNNRKKERSELTKQTKKITFTYTKKKGKATRYQYMLNNMLKGFLKSSKSIVFKCNFVSVFLIFLLEVRENCRKKAFRRAGSCSI